MLPVLPLMMTAGSAITFTVPAFDGDGDSLRYYWGDRQQFGGVSGDWKMEKLMGTPDLNSAPYIPGLPGDTAPPTIAPTFPCASSWYLGGQRRRRWHRREPGHAPKRRRSLYWAPSDGGSPLRLRGQPRRASGWVGLQSGECRHGYLAASRALSTIRGSRAL